MIEIRSILRQIGRHRTGRAKASLLAAVGLTHPSLQAIPATHQPPAPHAGFSGALRNVRLLPLVTWMTFVLPAVVWAGFKMSGLVQILVTRLELYILAPIRFTLWSRKAKEHFVGQPLSPGTDVAALGLQPGELMNLRNRARTEARIELGEFDQDGLFLSRVGPIQGMPMVEAGEFMKRQRFTLRLVLVEGSVVIEKDFRGAKSSFIRELAALRTLNAAGCAVPVVQAVDFKRCCLTMSFIKGAVLREQLAKAEPALRDRTLIGHPEYVGLAEPAARLKRIHAGRKALRAVISDELVEQVFRTLQDIHSAGVLPMNIKYGNILIEEVSGKPYLIDFEQACTPAFLGRLLFNALRDHDIEQFNLHFGTKHLTYPLLRAGLQAIQTSTPLYLRFGLSLGQRWHAAAGYASGRWAPTHDLPSLKGKRVLYVGPTTGFQAVQLLRLGPRQLIATEPDQQVASQNRFAKEALEWADNKRYDFECLQVSLSQLVERDLGRFDVIFTPCASYGGNGSFPRLVKHLGAIAPLLVCRPNTCVENGHIRWPDAVRILQENGFRVSLPANQPLDSQAFLIAEAT